MCSAPLARIVISLAILLCRAFAGSQSLPPIGANDNHSPAGTLRDGRLTLELEIAKGEWHPEADDGVGIAVYAFGESRHALQNPGPLIRVVKGTEVEASIRNRLPVSVTVHGLGDSPNSAILIAAGATANVQFNASKPGLYIYWAATDNHDLKSRHGVDAELSGAFVVDPTDHSPDDEIFVLEMLSEHPGIGSRQTLATINGKSWPFTHHFQYSVGRTAHWRWLNATNEPHAMHLHGFYFRVDATNRDGQITTYDPDKRTFEVTRRILQGETLDTTWTPDRPGQWLFHCHMLQHMGPAVVPDIPELQVTSRGASRDAHSMHDSSGMGQLVLGITVPKKPGSPEPEEWRPVRKLQLHINERSGSPRYALTLSDPARTSLVEKPGLIGPPIILTRGEPVEIEVVNNLEERTAIHWHGLEIESYYDGVPGWSGYSAQTTPAIEPGSSFIARINPPRAGTFIYHTHWHDAKQLENGLYGPLIVVPPGQPFDPATDRIFVFSIGDFGSLEELALINGTPQSRLLKFETNKKYRFRFINISTNNQGMQVSLLGPNGPVEWINIAKDGAEISPRRGVAQLTVTVGETYDVEFSTSTPQELLLDLLLPGQKIHTSQTLAFVSTTQ